MIWQVRKRDGRTMPFNMDKITSAIEKALRASGELSEEIQAEAATQKAVTTLSPTAPVLLLLTVSV